MNEKLIELIDKEIEEFEARLAADTIKLVNIKSVRSEPLPGAPFGEGARRVLDTFMDMANGEGFYTTDYGVGVISAAMKNAEPELGIWLHGDVVPEGDGWSFEPYNATEYKGCIIGRGATDNKGQLAAVFNLFRIFKKLGIKLNYNPAIYLGSAEETGMHDMIGIPDNPDARGFLNVCKPPKLSLVPDSGFPLGYGGKGSLNVTLTAKTQLCGYTFAAGHPDAPGNATATFAGKAIPEIDGCTVNDGEISTFSPPRHGAHPDPEGNMITSLSSILLENDLIPESDRYIFEFLRDVSHEVYGETFGIETEHERMRKLTVFSRRVDCEDGYITLSLNIRYPLGITYDEIVEKITAVSDKRGFILTSAAPGTMPYIIDPDSEVSRALYKAANDVTKDDKKPYTLSGGTYAHRLPNAYAYGMDGNLPPEDFPKGRGGAHGIDEAVSLFRLKRAMKIYARALLSLNDIRW